MKKIPKKYGGLLFSFLMSIGMGLIMTSVSTIVIAGFNEQFLSIWINDFIHVWPISFVVVLIVAPIVKRAVNYLIGSKDKSF